jgi:hypothetical protein
VIITLSTDKLRRSRAVWWTVVVALWFTAIPLLTHAMALDAYLGKGGIEICTFQGPQTVAPDDAHATDSPNGQESTSTHQHCPFCLHPADRFVPPPLPKPYLFLDQGGNQVPVAWQAFFYLDKTPLWAPSRGPPAVIQL